MTLSANTILNENPKNRIMEYAVPLLGFAGALLGIIIMVFNAQVDIRISIIGCVFASFVLAYLAWMQPKKDLVALSTPVYSLIFLGFPLDSFATVVLDFLYAVSLTVLLVRLRYRFGTSSTSIHDKMELAEPVRSYVEKCCMTFGSTGPKPAHAATVVFIRFAEGDFLAAAQAAESAIAQVSDISAPRCLQTAFAVVREQAERLDKSFPQPERFHVFPPEEAGVLAKTLDLNADKSLQYDTTLENALILLFACAWIRSEEDRPHLIRSQAFVVKLLAE